MESLEALQLVEYDESEIKMKELDDIHKNLACVQQIYKDLAELTGQQHEDLKTIEIKQEKVLDDTKATVETLKEAAIINTKTWKRALQISFGAIGSAVGLVAGPVGIAVGAAVGSVTGRIIGKKVEKSDLAEINNLR